MTREQEQSVLEGLEAELWPIASDEECRAYIRYRNLSLWFVSEGRDRRVWQGWNGANR
jgi:hypothetical protein